MSNQDCACVEWTRITSLGGFLKIGVPEIIQNYTVLVYIGTHAFGVQYHHFRKPLFGDFLFRTPLLSKSRDALRVSGKATSLPKPSSCHRKPCRRRYGRGCPQVKFLDAKPSFPGCSPNFWRSRSPGYSHFIFPLWPAPPRAKPSPASSHRTTCRLQNRCGVGERGQAPEFLLEAGTPL